MNEGHLKTRLFILRSIDWVLFIAVVAYAVYAFIFAEGKFVPALISFVGLLLVHWVGNYTNDKIALLRVNLGIQGRKYKKI